MEKTSLTNKSDAFESDNLKSGFEVPLAGFFNDHKAEHSFGLFLRSGGLEIGSGTILKELWVIVKISERFRAAIFFQTQLKEKVVGGISVSGITGHKRLCRAGKWLVKGKRSGQEEVDAREVYDIYNPQEQELGEFASRAQS